jgi:transposase
MDINPNSKELLEQRLNELYQQELSWPKVAKRLEVSAQYLNDVVNRRRQAGPKILSQLKLRSVVFYMDDE